MEFVNVNILVVILYIVLKMLSIGETEQNVPGIIISYNSMWVYNYLHRSSNFLKKSNAQISKYSLEEEQHVERASQIQLHSSINNRKELPINPKKDEKKKGQGKYTVMQQPQLTERDRDIEGIRRAGISRTDLSCELQSIREVLCSVPPACNSSP